VQYLMTTPSCSFRISAPSYYKVGERNSIRSAIPCILYSLQGQRRIVSDVQPSVETQPGCVVAISGQTELDGCYSCDSRDDKVSEKAGRKLETLRRSKMPNDEEEVLTEASMSSFSKMESKIRRRKGVTRQLYGRLQKHRRQNKRTLTRSDEEISKKLEDIRRYEQTCIDAIERITRVACKMQRQLANTLRNERNNVQLTEIVNIHSTDGTVDIATAQEMPARPVNPVSSARSVD